jgi:hypothetical protein
MTLKIDAGSGFAPERIGVPGMHLPMPWLITAVLLGVAIVLRHFIAGNTDVSWLLTAGERILDGQRLYRDVIETNPPMAVLVYIPGIVIARALHLPVEMVTDGLIFAAITVSLGIAARSLRHSSALDGVAGWPLAILAFAILTVLPTQTFGQREHIALVELLPALAVLAMRAKRETPPPWAIVAAGVGAGLALTFKPYFAIGMLCGVGGLAIHARSWRIVITPENVITVAIVGIYILCVAVFYPEFFTVIGPLVRDVYFPVGLSPGALLEKPAVTIWMSAALAALLLQRTGKIDATRIMLLTTSLGFAIVFLLQRKGWPYHSYPMIALALLALGYTIVSRRPPTGRDRALRAMAIIVFAALFSASLLWFDVAFDARPLQAPVARLGPHPKILAITAEPGLGHPLTRALNGVWVSRQQGIWVAGYLRYMRLHGQVDPQNEAVLNSYVERERAMLIEDIRKNPPTVVLVDNLTGDGDAWLRANPDVADLLKDYRLAEAVNGIKLLTIAP